MNALRDLRSSGFAVIIASFLCSFSLEKTTHPLSQIPGPSNHPAPSTLDLVLRSSKTFFAHMGVSENRGTLFWGPYNKDPTFRVPYLGPLFSDTPISLSLPSLGLSVECNTLNLKPRFAIFGGLDTSLFLPLVSIEGERAALWLGFTCAYGLVPILMSVIQGSNTSSNYSLAQRW